MAPIITPAIRFRVQDERRSADLAALTEYRSLSPEAREEWSPSLRTQALRLAPQVEAFPDSYSPVQYEAACEFMAAVYDGRTSDVAYHALRLVLTS